MAVLLELLVLQLRIFLSYVEAFCRWLFPPEPKNIRGDVVLITGAGSGIGRCLAEKFAAKGAKLALWDVNQEANEETARLVKESGCDARAYKCDVTQYGDVQRVAGEVRRELGNVDILVNNAGIGFMKDIFNLEEKEIRKTFDVNTISHFWTLKEFLPYMMSRNSGHVVTIASMAARHGAPLVSDYSASKFAVVGMIESVEQEVRRFGKENIMFSIVCPMFVNTNLLKEKEDRITVSSRFDPLLEPEDVAEAVVEGMLRNKYWIFIPDRLKNTHLFTALSPRKAQRLVMKFIDSAFYTKKKE